jgi:hypothetical protein
LDKDVELAHRRYISQIERVIPGLKQQPKIVALIYEQPGAAATIDNGKDDDP